MELRQIIRDGGAATSAPSSATGTSGGSGIKEESPERHNFSAASYERKLEEELQVKRDQLFKQLEEEFRAKQDEMRKEQEAKLKELMQTMQSV